MVMIYAENFERAIGRGIEFLELNQLPSGELKTLVASDPDIHLNAKHDPSIFSTVNVATSLLEVPGAAARPIIDKAAAFLQSEMLGGGLWRFWTKIHPGSIGMPPDVDDTACVSDFLNRIGRRFPENRGILLANRASNGLFRTWMTPRLRHLFFSQGIRFLVAAASNRSARKVYFQSGPLPPLRDGVDCVVNCNVLLFLGDSSFTEASSEWILRILQVGVSPDSDRWYQSDATLMYSAARCIERGIKSLRPAADLIEEKIRQIDPKSVSVLEAGLLACALAIVNPASEMLQAFSRYIYEHQHSDGGWAARVFYYDSPLCALCWGSRELTTGFCTEALSRILFRN
jgi:hypothetical protein